jgi:hypothetical protein
MESLLDEGKKYNIFKPGIDPLQVNINIAALGGYYLINQHTLGPDESPNDFYQNH